MPEGIFEQILELAKRRGFLYPSFEPYGGSAGFYDYGPLGAQLKANIENHFRRIFVTEEGCAEISCPTVTTEEVFIASGHVAKFDDPVVRCKNCRTPYRADHVLEETGFKGNASALSNQEIDAAIRETQTRCPKCKGEFDGCYRQNLMFKTEIGPGSGKTGYLRPETAQGIFVDFPLLYRYFREQVPFGVCQIGRAYRNEISPRQGVIRLREFNQMEVEVFMDPKRLTHPRFRKVRETRLTFVPGSTQQPVEMSIGDAVKQKIVANAALGYYLVLVHRLLTEVGLDPKRIRYRQHLAAEKAHYATDTWDAEFHSDRFGWVECVGTADRSAFDLTQHAKASGVAMKALRRYAEPRTVERTAVRPNPSRLGPLFRKDAVAVGAALQALDPKQAEAAQAQNGVDVHVDGQSLHVPRDAYEVAKETLTVQGEDYVPNVIEPSFGVDRILYAILEHNYQATQKEGEPYTVLRLPAHMAPVQLGVFPLMARDGLDRVAERLAERLRRAGYRVQYDEAGAIGRRYARMDEIGTPLCLTVDYQSLEDKTVTVRDRDSTRQERVPLGRVASAVRQRLNVA